MLTDSIAAKQVVDHVPIGVMVLSRDLIIEYANKRAVAMLGAGAPELKGLNARDASWGLVDRMRQPLPVDQYPAVRCAETQQVIENAEIGMPLAEGGDFRWFLINAVPEYDPQGEFSAVVLTFNDVSFQRNQIPFRQIVQNAHDVVVITKATPLRDGGPEIVYVNDAFERLTGYTSQEVLGKTPRLFQGAETDPEVRQRIYTGLKEGCALNEEILNYDRHGVPYWVDINIVPLRNAHDELIYFAAIQRDISAQKANEAQLTELAMKDALTGLPNRRALEQIMKPFLSGQGQTEECGCFAFVDIDFFKQINDEYGHDTGDHALIAVADILAAQVRVSDVVARLGGEEFVILLKNLSEPDARTRLEKLRQTVQATPLMTFEEQEISLTISIGYVCFAAGSDISLTQLLQCSDKAVYHAKKSGRNRVVAYQPEDTH